MIFHAHLNAVNVFWKPRVGAVVPRVPATPKRFGAQGGRVQVAAEGEIGGLAHSLAC